MLMLRMSTIPNPLTLMGLHAMLLAKLISVTSPFVRGEWEGKKLVEIEFFSLIFFLPYKYIYIYIYIYISFYNSERDDHLKKSKTNP